ncbi:MAG: phospholipase/carboxylesterase, partial [Pseudomonadota bacterium]|nr:phospholipase/carboxylesterase [Pseudomonadota bacterium]
GQINDFIRREMERGIKPQRIILAGFSQGGAIALYTGLRQNQPLAGIMALSTYMPLMASHESGSHHCPPVFMAHGLHDDIVNYRYGVQSRLWLQQQNCQVDWHDYPMAHSVCMEEIADIRQWLLKVLAV